MEKDKSEDTEATNGHDQEKLKQVEKGKDPEAQKAQVNQESNGVGDQVFPDAFYCPLTGKVMKDPVVHPNGKSFESSAVASDTDVVYYPNRALQAVIEHEVLRRNDPLHRTIDCMRKSIHGLVQGSNLPVAVIQEFHPLPEHYYCSITLDIMKHPVIDPDGQTFDRRALVNWIRVNGSSPATRKPLTVNQLYKNTAIKDLLDEEVNREDRLMHPCIRQWRDQTEEEDNCDEINLEEVDHPGNNNTATATSMEEIEELRRQRVQRQRCLKLKFLLTLLLVIIGFLYFPYATITFVALALLITSCLKGSEAQQIHEEALARERGRNVN